MRITIGGLFLPLLALGSIGYAGWHVYRANQPLPKAVPPIPPVIAPFAHTLAASGIVEPTTEDVVVGTHVAGVVERVHVSAGERVAVGAPLFRIDARQAVAESAVRRARAQVEQARTEIARLTVTSPIDGDVLKVDVRAGEQVGTAAGQRLMVLGRIRPLCVRADFDESEIPRFDKTASAHAHPRGDSSRTYRLRFVRVEPYVVPKRSLTGDNRERVDTRVLQVVYAVENDSPGLFVGQQVDVFVDLDGSTGSSDQAVVRE